MNNTVDVNDDPGPPESWEIADVEASLKRLLVSSTPANFAGNSLDDDAPISGPAPSPDDDDDDAVNQVDQFLREALQNPRERLSILRMEQNIEQFIRDPMRQQLEFQQLPTSYLRLAAHRLAQHYFLQSTVITDNSISDGSGSRIIVYKTSAECRFPRVRLANIPVTIPQENNGAVKLAIKQRPQKYTPGSRSDNSGSDKANHSKSVEERKEEYNRARARIFNSTTQNGSSSVKPHIEIPKVENKSIHRSSASNSGRSVADSSTGSSRAIKTRAENPVSRNRQSNRVAIFRDREIESKDPDYDRSYDRYTQRFDPGFGFSAGPYPVRPLYAPAINYNTEFPQLGAAHRPQVTAEPPRSHLQHIPAQWASQSNPAVGYGHPDTMMNMYNTNHVSARSSSTVYLHAPQYPHPLQSPGVPYIHPHEQFLQTYQQSRQEQHDATLGLARPH
ncbi:hypothetical protein vseg_001013 [Gypsophila vaccaria]